MTTWEELQEDEMNYNNEDIEELFCEEWSEEGFKEAGNIMKDILSEVLAFSELHVGTYSRPMSALQLVHGCPTQKTPDDYETKVGAVPPNSKERLLLCGAVPPDRSAELEN